MRRTVLVPAAAVLVTLGAIAGAAQLAGPGSASPGHATAAAQQAPVTSAALACPPAGGAAGTVAFIASPGTTTQAAPGKTPAPATSAPATSAQATSGHAQLAPLPLTGTALRAAAPISQNDPGVLRLLTIPAAQSAGKQSAPALQGWSVAAAGVMAQALEAEVATGSGLGTVRCGEPGSDLWFVGPGQNSGATQIQLDLMNVDALAASVNVTLVTDAGQIAAGPDTAITVPAHQTVTQSLSSAAAGSSVVAIRVQTSIGRVAADVSEETAAGGAAAWLPATAPPSTQLLIPGLAKSGSAAKLFIVVPGSANAQISVQAITSQGRYKPFGTQAVDLPGHSASYVPLTPLGGSASALELTANVPVAAAVLVPGSGLGTFTTATAAISQQAVVAGNTAGSGVSISIVLSAPAGQARARVTELSSPAGNGASSTSSQEVTVPAGRTLAVPAAAPKGAASGSAFAVVVTPLAGSGPLYGARVATVGSQGAVASIIPAVSALTTISLPPTRDSYPAISP